MYSVKKWNFRAGKVELCGKKYIAIAKVKISEEKAQCDWNFTASAKRAKI